MSLKTANEEFLAELVALAVERPLSHWNNLPDSAIAIPDHLVTLGAFYEYIDGGGVHGFHLDHYYRSLNDLRGQFRRCVKSIEAGESSDYEGKEDESNEICSMDPNKPSGKDYQVAAPGPVQKEQPTMTARHLDKFGNFWTTDRPRRTELSYEKFCSLFAGFSLVLIQIETDQVFAAGNDERCLAAGLSARDLDPSTFQIEPGPVPTSAS